ncbi:MAG: hypothetical protein ACJ8AH_13470, partial [Stellaceae bacterium]
HFLLGGILVTYLPEAHRRFGVAKVTQTGVVLAAIGIAAWANAQQPGNFSQPLCSAGLAGRQRAVQR